MKEITKTTLGSNVLNRQISQGIPVEKSDAITRWEDFSAKKRKTVRNKMLPQQFNLCGYTEFQIEEFCTIASSKKGCHIEHIKPKSKFPSETFSYNNLLISILESNDLTKFKSLDFDNDPMYFGGHHKQDNYCNNQFISPISNPCENYFMYIEDSGEIIPSTTLNKAETDNAVYTIELLNLNHPFLMNRRKKRMREVSEDIDLIEDKKKLKDIRDYELGVHNGKQFSFPSAVASLF